MRVSDSRAVVWPVWLVLCIFHTISYCCADTPSEAEETDVSDSEEVLYFVRTIFHSMVFLASAATIGFIDSSVAFHYPIVGLIDSMAMNFPIIGRRDNTAAEYPITGLMDTMAFLPGLILSFVCRLHPRRVRKQWRTSDESTWS